MANKSPARGQPRSHRIDLQYFVQQGWCTHVRGLLAESRRRELEKKLNQVQGPTGDDEDLEGINNRHGPCQKTLLHLAVVHKAPSAAYVMSKLLLKYGACPAIRDSSGCNALSLACGLGRQKIVHYMLTECDVELNGQDNDGRTSLAHAVLSRDLETVRLMVMHLTANYLTVDVPDKNGISPLMLAIKANCPAIVRVLVQDGRAGTELAISHGYNPQALLERKECAEESESGHSTKPASTQTEHKFQSLPGSSSSKGSHFPALPTRAQTCLSHNSRNITIDNCFSDEGLSHHSKQPISTADLSRSRLTPAPCRSSPTTATPWRDSIFDRMPQMMQVKAEEMLYTNMPIPLAVSAMWEKKRQAALAKRTLKQSRAVGVRKLPPAIPLKSTSLPFSKALSKGLPPGGEHARLSAKAPRRHSLCQGVVQKTTITELQGKLSPNRQAMLQRIGLTVDSGESEKTTDDEADGCSVTSSQRRYTLPFLPPDNRATVSPQVQHTMQASLSRSF